MDMDTAANRAPRVTVIVPSYNHARYLPQRLESIFSQTYRDFELIVLDDASTDNSAELLRPYAERGEIQLVVNTQNSGSPFAQWARGAALARGELLWIAESDDFADPRLLERLAATFDRHPGVGLAYCQSWQVDSAGNVGASCEEFARWLDPVRWTGDYINAGRDEVARFLTIQNTIPNASAVLVRTALLRRAVLGANTFRLCGDWITWINVLLESDVAFVAECLNGFRTHDKSVRLTTRRNLDCAECLALKVHACAQLDAPSSVRKRSFNNEYPRWRDCLEADDLRAQWPWVKRTVRDGFRLWPSGGWRMLRNVLWVTVKRTVKHHLFKAAPASR